MKVLVACEESQVVCKEFRNLGYEAYSCDILVNSGGQTLITLSKMLFHC